MLSCVVMTLTLGGVGCSKPTPQAGTSQTATQERRLSFDPELHLKWPGPPHEGSQLLPTEAGEARHYSATFADKRSGGVINYTAFVEEYPADSIKKADPEELLSAYVFAFQADEVSRKKIEYGPRKYPGLDIVSQRDGRFDRKLVVMADRRMYHIGVSSTKEEWLKDPAVQAFFDSFSLND
jgi:hypothetical protein